MQSEAGDGRILGHMVVANGQSYVYDVYSNEILLLEKGWDCIARGLLAGAPREEIIRNYDAQSERRSGKAAFRNFMREARIRDVLQPVPIREAVEAPSVEAIRHELDHHIMALCLEITQSCNLRCEYCQFSGASQHFAPIRANSERRMPNDIAIAAIDFYIRRSEHIKSKRAVSFYGGEPLLAVDGIAKAIDYVNSRLGRGNCTFHLTTNGIQLSHSATRAFVVSNDISILVSVDGPQRLHDAFRKSKGGKGTYQTVERGLEALLREYPDYYHSRVRVNAVVVNPAYHEEVSDFFRAWPLTPSSREFVVRYSPVDTMGNEDLYAQLIAGGPEPMPADPERLDRREQFVRNRMVATDPCDGLEKLEGNLLVQLAQRPVCPVPGRVIPSGFCVPGARKLFVTVDGELAMCEKVSRRGTIGNLRDGFDVERIHSILSDFYRLWTIDCSQCVAQRLCGLCAALVSDECGNLAPRLFQQHCFRQRIVIPLAIEDFVRICTSNPSYFKKLENTILA